MVKPASFHFLPTVSTTPKKQQAPETGSGTCFELERAMGFEPTTSCLEGRNSTTELHPRR